MSRRPFAPHNKSKIGLVGVTVKSGFCPIKEPNRVLPDLGKPLRKKTFSHLIDLIFSQLISSNQALRPTNFLVGFAVITSFYLKTKEYALSWY